MTGKPRKRAETDKSTGDMETAGELSLNITPHEHARYLVKLKKRRAKAVYMGAAMLLLAAGTIFGVGFSALPTWLAATIGSLVGIAAVAGTVFCGLHFQKTYKILFLLQIVAFVLMLVYVFLEQSGFMSIFQTERPGEALGIYLRARGGWATVLLVVLQFAQTIILPIPSVVLTGAGTLLYSEMFGTAIGPLVSAAAGLAGIMAGSVCSFLLGRHFGYKLVAWIVGKESLKKALVMVRGKDTVVLTLMFLLPYFPDDILCFVAGLSSMGFWYFLFVIFISRILVLAGSAYLIGLFQVNLGWGIGVTAAIILFSIVAFVIAFKKGDKIDAFFRRKFHRKHDKRKNFDFAQDLINKLDKEIREEQIEEERLRAHQQYEIRQRQKNI